MLHSKPKQPYGFARLTDQQCKMNLVTERIGNEISEDIRDNGLEAYRLEALRHLQLKTVIKESHGSLVHRIYFNNIQSDCSNLFATVGGDQATIYDDTHTGDSIAIMMQYSNTKTPYNAGGELRCCEWLNCDGWETHPHQEDACLAVSGVDPVISVISIVEASVLYQLKGHKKEVVHLRSCRKRSHFLISLSKESEMRLWDVPNETCLAKVSTEANCLAVCPSNDCIFTNARKLNTLQKWEISDASEDSELENANHPSGNQTSLLASETIVLKGEMSHLETIYSLLCPDSDTLLILSTDGRCTFYDPRSWTMQTAWKVPGLFPSSRKHERCQLNSVSGGELVCIGNLESEVFVYKSKTGKLISTVQPPKVNGPAWACALSHDCRHLLSASGHSFIFRFEYVKPVSKTTLEKRDSQKLEST